MSVEFSLLRCLLDGPASTEKLRSALEGLDHYYPLRNANLYAVLNQLEERGQVHSEPLEAGADARRRYSITEAGSAALREWIASPPESLLGEVRDPLHLRLVLATEDPSRLDWLSWAIPEVDAETERAKQLYEAKRRDMTPVARLAVEELIANLERRRAFLARALALAQSQAPAADSEG